MKTQPYSSTLLKYIPFLYVIWADDLISPSEIQVFKSAIEKDDLNSEEKKQLLSLANPDNPPTLETRKNWKELIDASGVTLTENISYPLSAFSEKVANYYNSTEKNQLNQSLKAIELNLGIQPNHYRHLFKGTLKVQENIIPYQSEVIDQIMKGDNTEYIDEFRSLLKDAIFDWKLFRDKDAHRAHVLNQVKFLAEKGYGALGYQKAYGGIGKMTPYGSIFEHLMYIDASLTVKFGVQFGLFGGSIQNLGTKKHHDKWLNSTGKAQTLGCFAMTETRHGSNVKGIKTTATYIHETKSIIINTPGPNDNKEYIGNALHSSMATVFAQLIVNGENKGVHAILCEIRNKEGNLNEGITVEDNGYKLGLNGVDNGKIWFNNVAVPKENLLNRFGDIDDQGNYTSPIENSNKRFFTMLGTLVGGRICVAKGALSGAKYALHIATKYALNRRQFNSVSNIQEDLIMDYPSHQMRLMIPIASSYVYQATLDKIIRDYDTVINQDTRKIETQVAALKATITWFANNTIQECREACGGKGYLLENRIGDLKNDVDIFTTFEGDNTVLLQLAAKGVLTDFQSDFNSDSFVDILKYVGKNISDKLTTINPIFTNKTDKEHLYSSEFHLEALRYRTRRLTFSAASRMRKYIKSGMPSYQAFLKVQTHLIVLGEAYAHQMSYKIFTDFLQTIGDKEHQQLFEKLGTLYALQTIKTNADWYLEHGYLSTNKSKAIKRRLERLCSELRPYASTLVDGYGIPKKCITAPIAK
ncbi:acyl-CoA dehydrogenase [Zhouia sp. PK063]|uniref:acyl-CoA dehydrogenase family protein n=1 Tax=Zhouia sp. PK063 TaxID=3373602 RepID=UPI0037A1105B